MSCSCLKIITNKPSVNKLYIWRNVIVKSWDPFFLSISKEPSRVDMP